MASSDGIRTCADALMAVLLAPACAACDTPLDSPTRGPVCGSCWHRIVTVTPPVCETCAGPLPSWRVISIQHRRCARCRRRGSALSRARAIGAYDGALRDIIHALKYDRRRSLAAPLAARLRIHGADVLMGADVAVPVPLHRSRRRRRGFNQAADLARHLGLPVADALRRTRPTPSQTDLPASRRYANVLGAFALRRRHDVAGCCVVLVDDVSTTGATLEACARVLLDAGAREVRALTVARAVSRQR
jgi:ComF family protein